jgi:hypothetical protein
MIVVSTVMTHALRYGVACLLVIACEPRAARHREARHATRMDDPVARILDRQTALSLTGGQVTQLIALHEAMRVKERPIQDRMRSLTPASRGERRQWPEVSRESVGTLADMLREIHWRAESSADSLLTDQQRQAAARLAMDQDRAAPGGR